MADLEHRIVDSVYKFETKRTARALAGRLLTALAMLFAGFILVGALLDIYAEQHSFDLLSIFRENYEVIRAFAWDSVVSFYQETPKIIVLCIIMIGAGLILLSLNIIRNYRRLRNRIRSVLTFWTKKP